MYILYVLYAYCTYLMYLLYIFYILNSYCTYPLLCCFVLAPPPRTVVFDLQPHGRLTANFWFCPTNSTI